MNGLYKKECLTVLIVLVSSCSDNTNKNYSTTIDSIHISPKKVISKPKINPETLLISNYRLKAFDTIEFGSHNNQRNSLYKILNSYHSTPTRKRMLIMVFTSLV